MGFPNIDPSQIMKMLGMNANSLEDMKSKVVDGVLDKAVSVLYKEFPENERNTLFNPDPRRSDKENAVCALVTKALPKFLSKLNENDLTLMYNKIQNMK